MIHKRNHYYKNLENQQIDMSKALIGTAVGGVIALTAAFLLTRGSNCKTSSGIVDKIECLGEKTMGKGHDVIDQIAEYAENIKDHASKYFDSCPKGSVNSKLLVCGALSGGVIGALSLLLLNGGHKEEKEHKITEFIKNAGRNATRSMPSIDWIEVARQLIHAINSKGSPAEFVEEKVGQCLEGSCSDSIHDAINLAMQGVKIWKKLTNRR